MSAPTSPPVVTPIPDGRSREAIQRRTLGTLLVAQIVGSVGGAIGISVGALLTAEMVGVAVSGLAQSAAVVGAALLAIPATQIVLRYGRRPSLTAGFLLAAIGAATVVAASLTGSIALLFLGFFLFGGGTTAGLQARYAAVDLALPSERGRHLSIVVWGSTVGAVAGPNLAPVAGSALLGYGVAPLAAPFVFSSVLFAVASIVLLIFLRPDPLMVARGASSPGGGPPAARGLGMRAAFAVVAANPSARLGVGAAAVGHLVMVGVMSMTPIHIQGAGHDPTTTLSLVGIVLSVHIAGMFALAPLTGWLTDRFGRPPVVAGGAALLVIACGLAGTAGDDSLRLGIGLTILGLGWSGTMVAGSTLLSESVADEVRASAQGLSDLVMGIAGALAGALSGFAIEAGGYPLLAGIGALFAAPLVVVGRKRSF